MVYLWVVVANCLLNIRNSMFQLHEMRMHVDYLVSDYFHYDVPLDYELKREFLEYIENSYY